MGDNISLLGMGNWEWGIGNWALALLRDGAWGTCAERSRSMGHRAWGMGHGAWGMGHGAWGMGSK
ncbi:MAG TPA: hypothetical protein DD001_16535 [Microcoleaceae bacterium UBA10368]|jgi:hypothetical protein|nr:hypothetical protein [Microcoleaceae cyanobacterium UBA10368]